MPPSPPPLDGYTASKWRFRAPMAALEGPNREWHIYSMRLMGGTDCAESSAYSAASLLQNNPNAATSTGFACDMASLCQLFNIHGPRNAFSGAPGMELHTGFSSAWRGRAGGM